MGEVPGVECRYCRGIFTSIGMNGGPHTYDHDWTECCGEVADKYHALSAAADAAMQRLNESGTGEMGLIDTIHAAHKILRDAR